MKKFWCPLKFEKLHQNFFSFFKYFSKICPKNINYYKIFQN